MREPPSDAVVSCRHAVSIGIGAGALGTLANPGRRPVRSPWRPIVPFAGDASACVDLTSTGPLLVVLWRRAERGGCGGCAGCGSSTCCYGRGRPSPEFNTPPRAFAPASVPADTPHAWACVSLSIRSLLPAAPSTFGSLLCSLARRPLAAKTPGKAATAAALGSV